MREDGELNRHFDAIHTAYDGMCVGGPISSQRVRSARSEFAYGALGRYVWTSRNDQNYWNWEEVKK